MLEQKKHWRVELIKTRPNKSPFDKAFLIKKSWFGSALKVTSNPDKANVFSLKKAEQLVKSINQGRVFKARAIKTADTSLR